MRSLCILSLLVIVAVSQLSAQVARSEADLILQQCRHKEADVFFILDASSSIYIEDYSRQRQFVREVVERFDISPQNTRVGIVVFSDTYQVVFNLNQYTERHSLLDGINERNIPYLTGLTNTDDAIRYVRTSRQFRNNITKVIIVITDGYSREPGSTLAEAEAARREGFYLFVIGVGQYTDEREWRGIANDPDHEFMFNITDYRALNRLHTSIPSKICILPPIILGTCNVERAADLMFLAEPRGASEAFTIVQALVNNLQEPIDTNRLSLSLHLGDCVADNVRLDDPRAFCSDFGHFKPNNYQNTVRNMIDRAAEARRRRPSANQIAILFVDSESTDQELQPLIRLIAQARIRTYVVVMGSSNRILSRTLAGIASANDRIFRTSDQFAIEEQITRALCSSNDLNRVREIVRPT